MALLINHSCVFSWLLFESFWISLSSFYVILFLLFTRVAQQAQMNVNVLSLPSLLHMSRNSCRSRSGSCCCCRAHQQQYFEYRCHSSWYESGYSCVESCFFLIFACSSFVSCVPDRDHVHAFRRCRCHRPPRFWNGPNQGHDTWRCREILKRPPDTLSCEFPFVGNVKAGHIFCWRCDPRINVAVAIYCTILYVKYIFYSSFRYVYILRLAGR